MNDHSQSRFHDTQCDIIRSKLLTWIGAGHAVWSFKRTDYV
jgi:hypothetical protein